ncbi:MAG: ABC transporter ATP-binding protein [Christensenellaceae bacterium]|nr:ABC transporter ATP-binding protein [Christensenellaceae bacterium]
MKESLLRLEKIEKSYGKIKILGPIDLEIRKGEIIGIKGKNGAGKSTLLKIMAGVLKESAGKVIIDHDLILGYVPQDIALYPELTGKQNLRFFADLENIPQKSAKRRIDWLLERLMLSDAANKKLSQYSGGMKRRLNLAAALIKTPQLILLDEPTVGADAESAEIILKLIKDLAAAGSAVVLIDHYEEELNSTANRLITIQDGKISE